MQEPCPALTCLTLVSEDAKADVYGLPAPALPGGFLDGSTHLLQSLELQFIPFPALPNLLLSATNLICLILGGIPDSWYISPEVIATGLAGLANLKYLAIEFLCIRSSPNREIRPPPPSMCVLPALTLFQFKGLTEYLEDLTSRIDAPLLDSIQITKLDHLISDFPHLTRLMRRATKFQALNEVYVYFIKGGFGLSDLQVRSLPPSGGFHKEFRLEIKFKPFFEEFPPLEKAFTSFLPSIYGVDHLYLFCIQNSVQSVEFAYMMWLEILRPFSAVKNLYISKEVAKSVFLALNGLGERVTDVLPALETLFLSELRPSTLIQNAIEQFVATRQLLGHPVAVSPWDGLQYLTSETLVLS